MNILTLKELAGLAKLLGVSIEAARECRRTILESKYARLMMAATYGDCPETARKEYRETASRVLAIMHREEDTLYTEEAV